VNARIRPILAVAGLLVLGGCATVAPDAALSDVERVASERLGGQTKVRWNEATPEKAQARDTIARLLEEPLTAESAVQIALLNNRHLQAAYEELGIAEADLVQAGLLENPSFSAEILVGNGSVDPSYTLVQNFFSLMTLSARRTVASSAFERAKYDLGSKILDVAADVRSAYYKLVADEQAAELFRQVISATEAAAELSQRQVQAGNASPRDQALQQAQYAQAVLDLSRTEAQIASDREALNRLLGLWGDQVAWNLPERLPDVPADKPSLEGLETAAIEHRLDLAGARAEVQTAGYALDLGRQLRWLSVLGLGIKFERDPDSRKWLKGPVIEFALPIFDWGQARVAGLEAQRRRSEKALAALAVDVRSQVRDAWARLVAAQDAAAYYQKTLLPLRQQIVEEETRLYNGMLIGVYDLLRSRQEQINAARDYIGTLRDYWVARSDLEKALAGPLPGAHTARTTTPPSQTALRTGT
jgi:cobalt-zinc-cadmium efflux system outer membrane protein